MSAHKKSLSAVVAALPLPLRVLSFALIAGLAGWLSVQLAFPGNLSPLWLPAGLGVAAVMAGERQGRPWGGAWYLLGLWGGCVVADIADGFSSPMASVMELGSVAEVALTVLVVRRWGGGSAGVGTLRGTLVLLGGGALLGCPLGATVGSLVISQISPEPASGFAGHWIVWWLGDTSGILLLAPALLRCERSDSSRRDAPGGAWWPAFLALLVVGTATLFLRPWVGDNSDVGNALTYLSFPCIAVAGLWRGATGVAVAVGLAGAVALAGTLRGLGPFTDAPVTVDVMLLQVYVIAMAVTGHVLAAVGFERERALRAMARSTDRLMAAERLAGIGWWHLDEASGERAWSEGMFHVLGVGPGSPLAGPTGMDALIEPADRSLFDRYRGALAALADGEGVEFRVRRPDGAERWLICRHTAARESPSGYFGVLKDITDQKNQTLALYESEQTLRRVFDQSPLGVAVVSLDYRFLKVNASLCRLTGYSADELLGRGVADITHPEDITKSFADVPALLAGEIEQMAVEKRYLHKDGGVLWINVLTRPIRDEMGRPLLFASMMEDITRRHRTEQALAEAKLAAEQSSLAKTGFLAAISHDLRQPLMAANLFLESLDRRLDADGQPAPELERVRQALTAMTELLDVLLDLSQLDSGIVRVERRPVALGRLLGDLARNWSEVAASRGLALRSVATSAVVDTDPVLIKRILRNLLDNAVKYTASGRLLLGCRRAGAEVRVQVWDTGVGIAADKLEAIFGEFYQIDNPNRDRSRGLGMGLSIVDRLAAAIGCRVAVRSRPGLGSMFEIALPRTRQRSESTFRSAAAAAPGPGGLVVVIEDDTLVAEALETLLSAWGRPAVIAASAEQAWERLRAGGGTPALLIIDYRLAAGWTGLDAVVWLQERLGAQVPAVLVSGESGGEELERIRAAGLRFIPKPITPETLLAILAEYTRP